MNTNMSIEEIKNLVKAHWRLQMGSYFSEIKKLNGAIYNVGGLVKDYYWNYACMINVKNNEIELLINEVIDTANKLGLEPAFYIDPTTNPSSFSQYLSNKSFKADDDEIWMQCNNIDDLDYKDISLEVREATSENDMNMFIDVFNVAYEMLEEGETTSTYSNSLLLAYQNPPENVTIKHYLGFYNKEIVGISSIYVSGSYAGLYNVAVLPEFRKKGFGRILSVKASQEGFSNGASNILLQTELDGPAHKLYSTMGFKDSFIGTIWAK